MTTKKKTANSTAREAEIAAVSEATEAGDTAPESITPASTWQLLVKPSGGGLLSPAQFPVAYTVELAAAPEFGEEAGKPCARLRVPTSALDSTIAALLSGHDPSNAQLIDNDRYRLINGSPVPPNWAIYFAAPNGTHYYAAETVVFAQVAAPTEAEGGYLAKGTFGQVWPNGTGGE